MTSPIQSLIDAVRRAVFDGPAVTTPAQRAAVAAHARRPHPVGGLSIGDPTHLDGTAVPESARRYLDKVVHAPSRVTDADFASTHTALGDDATFELSVAAAVEAGLFRYEHALTLLSEES